MKKKQGGKRKGAGRKPVSDKKVPIRFFVHQSRIDMMTEDMIIRICITAIESSYERGLRAVRQKKKNNVL